MEKEVSLFIVLDDYYHQSRDLLKERDYQSLKQVFQEAYHAILKDKTGEYFAIAEALAIVLSQFVAELLGSEEDLGDYGECFANEVAIYEAFLQHEETINGYVNLSMALSHSAYYHYKNGDYEQSANFEKERLNNLSLALVKSYAGEKSDRYDIESIELSIYKSVCGLISSSEQMEMADRMNNLQTCATYLNGILSQNKHAAVKIYSLANAITEELFIYYKDSIPPLDTVFAMHYILHKLLYLVSLIEVYGEEEAIIDEMRDTYLLCSEYVVKNLHTINDKGQLVWKHFVEILSNYKTN